MAKGGHSRVEGFIGGGRDSWGLSPAPQGVWGKGTESETRRSGLSPLPLETPGTEGPLWVLQISHPRICMGEQVGGRGKGGGWRPGLILTCCVRGPLPLGFSSPICEMGPRGRCGGRSGRVTHQEPLLSQSSWDVCSCPGRRNFLLGTEEGETEGSSRLQGAPMLTLDQQGDSNRDGKRRQEPGTGREKERHRNSERNTERKTDTERQSEV